MRHTIKISCDDGLRLKEATIDGEPVKHPTSIKLEHAHDTLPTFALSQLGGPDGADGMDRRWAAISYNLEIEIETNP